MTKYGASFLSAQSCIWLRRRKDIPGKLFRLPAINPKRDTDSPASADWEGYYHSHLSNWVGPRMCVCVCICPVSCHQLILTILWVMVPTTWPLGPGRGGLLSPTTALEVPAALFRVYLTPMKKMPCRFLQFVKVINLLTCISQLIHIEFGDYCCLQGRRGKRSSFVPDVVKMFLLLTQRI